MFDANGNYYRMEMSNHYRLEKLYFKRFRHLDGLEIDFTEKNVTGIFGANGLGKSTILSVIRCLYQAVYHPRRRGNKVNAPSPVYSMNAPFGHLFFGNQFSNYAGSEIIVEFSNQKTGRYSLQIGRNWSPGTSAKPVCPVYYISMASCVPTDEANIFSANRKQRANQYRHILEKNVELKIAFNKIFNNAIDISSIPNPKNSDETISITKGTKKIIFRDLSAGEQRVLRLLDVLYSAVNNSIVLIDEIELTLHPMALDRLIGILNHLAKERNLQIIFTSHSIELMSRKDIAIRSLYSVGSSIQCMQGYSQECMDLLQGKSSKPITILMEDDMSLAIVMTLLQQMNKMNCVSRIKFGGYDTAFKLACALYKVNNLTEKMVFVLDGDVVTTEDDRMKEIKQSGMIEHISNEDQYRIAQHFVQYALPKGEDSIESYFYNLIVSDEGKTDPIVQAAKRIIQYTSDTIPKGINSPKRFLKHYKLQDTIINLGYDKSSMLPGYLEVVKYVSVNHHTEWNKLTTELRQWIEKYI